MHTWWSVAFPAAVCTALFAAVALANPRTGEPLPAFQVADVTGQMHRASEIRGQPALVIALTSSEAGGATSTWFDRARERYGTTRVQYVTLVSLDLSHFVPTSFARSAARDRTPREYWHTTWFDRSGSIRGAFGFARGDRVPYVMVVGRDGRVSAATHSEFSPGAAQAIWSALDGESRGD